MEEHREGIVTLCTGGRDHVSHSWICARSLSWSINSGDYRLRLRYDRQKLTWRRKLAAKRSGTPVCMKWTEIIRDRDKKHVDKDRMLVTLSMRLMHLMRLVRLMRLMPSPRPLPMTWSDTGGCLEMHKDIRGPCWPPKDSPMKIAGSFIG